MIKYPNIDPVAISIPIPGFWGDALNIHWYGLAYVVGAYLIYLRMAATRNKFGIEASKEEVDMPVFFYVDPEFLDDPLMDGIKTLTLSYTFFKTEHEEEELEEEERNAKSAMA